MNKQPVFEAGDFMLSENDVDGRDFPYSFSCDYSVIEVTWIAIDVVDQAIKKAMA